MVVLVGLCFALIVVVGLRLARRFAPLWKRGAILLVTLYIAYRVTFALARGLRLQGMEGWIILVGVVGIGLFEIAMRMGRNRVV